jgi:hypothetical protein
VLWLYISPKIDTHANFTPHELDIWTERYASMIRITHDSLRRVCVIPSSCCKRATMDSIWSRSSSHISSLICINSRAVEQAMCA